MGSAQSRSTRTVLLYGRTGKWRIETSYERAFRAVGWEVVRYDAEPSLEDLSWWLRSRVGRRLTRSCLQLRRLGGRRRNEAVRQRVREVEPDLVLLINGALVMPETVTAIRKAGTPVTVFHPDAPLPGNQNHRPEHLPVAQKADICFVWSRRLRTHLEGKGARRAVYLPFAWDSEVFPYVRNSEKKCGPEVIFVGGWDPLRERWLEPVAERFELEIWGPDYWNTRTRAGSAVRDSWQGKALRGAEASDAVARADVALNILRKQNLPDGTNMRTFEIPGAGGFPLATRTSGAKEIYAEGEAGAYFGSIEELLKTIAYYLEHPQERLIMARRAHNITASKHRYVHRANQIVESVESVG